MQRTNTKNVLSAGVEPSRLGHLVPVFVVGAKLPCEGADAGNDAHKDERVGPPVRGLGVPAASGRPDVLWVTKVTGVSEK